MFKKKTLKKKQTNQTQNIHTHVTWLPRFKLKKIKNFMTTDHLKPEIPQNFLLVWVLLYILLVVLSCSKYILM